jgi:mono/diheme cytochrome c family protein
MVNQSTRLRAIMLVCAATLTSGVYAADDKTERGKYLVEEVAQCQNCHTPRLTTGEMDKSKWLKGATLNVQPIEPIEKWHKTAPDLTPSGRLWTRWKEEGLVKFMQTGRGPSGNVADPPMPTYKLTKDDAEAVVEYLKTLK